MTAPNIVNVTTITGKTALVKLSNSTATSVLANGASSGKVLKLSGVLAANTEGHQSTSPSISTSLARVRTTTWRKRSRFRPSPPMKRL